MIQRNEQLVIVRGGGDIATGTISRLFRSGYPVVTWRYPHRLRSAVRWRFQKLFMTGRARLRM